MILEFVATLALGFAAGGVALLLRRLSGGRAPAWLVPVAAGAGMLGYAVWSEYTWFPRTQEALPQGVEVIATAESSVVWKPWTLIWPQTTRLLAVDAAGARTHEAAPGWVIADVLAMERFAPSAAGPVLVDCTEGRSAELADGVEFDADGVPRPESWTELAADDPLLDALCR
jgi:hypothetical protein